MKIITKFAIAAVAIIAACTPASAQMLQIGPRIGTEVSRLSFDKDVFDGENRAGFAGGLQLEFTAPVIGIGFDISAMYVHRNNNGIAPQGTPSTQVLGSYNTDYIEVPLNFKYKIGLPVVGKIVTPYVFTGPSVAFLTSKEAINAAFNNKKVNVAWNFGIGVQLFSHLQIGASYGLGITKAVEYVTPIQGVDIKGKNNYWTITAAWLFKVL